MVKLDFTNFSFEKKDDFIKVIFGKYYYFTVPLDDFTNIDSDIEFQEKSLTFPNITEKSADNKVNRIIDRGLMNLKSALNHKEVLFIDENSRIPLIGSGEFGIVDRNTSILELKPVTGCNLNCIYCSVNEGNNNKSREILVDPYYLAQEAAKLAAFKKHPVEFSINPHGEPLLYPFLEELIEGLREISNCNVVSMNTNGTLLSKQRIDSLQKAGMTRLNISIDTLDKKISSQIAGKPFPMDHVLKMVEYAQSKELSVLIAPLIVPGFNDDNDRDIEPLIKFAKSLKGPFPTIGFQKFLSYKNGRNPAKEIPFEDFFANLKTFEGKYDIVLTPKSNYNPFGIFMEDKLEKPIKKNQTIKVEIITDGRKNGDKLCSYANRVITVRGLAKEKGTARVKIVRDKHNIYMGVPAS